MTDLPTLGRLKEPWTLSLDRQLTRPTTPQEIGRASLLPYEVSGACTLVYQEGSLLGYVQTEAGADRDRWAVLHLGLASQADLRPLAALLEQLCYRAAEHGAGRVFAAVVDEAGVDLFRRAGFVAYADETLYRMVGEETREEEIARLVATFAIRVQRPRDVWGIHSLYGAVTPRPVQLVENLTSDYWEAPAAGWRAWLGGKPEARLILEVEAGVCGYLRLAPSWQGHRLEMMIHPQRREMAGHLLQAGLNLLADYPPLPLYCALRGYQAELAGVLEPAGFRAVGSQSLLVKQMAVRVRQRQRIFQPVLERALEPARINESANMRIGE